MSYIYWVKYSPFYKSVCHLIQTIAPCLHHSHGIGSTSCCMSGCVRHSSHSHFHPLVIHVLNRCHSWPCLHQPDCYYQHHHQIVFRIIRIHENKKVVHHSHHQACCVMSWLPCFARVAGIDHSVVELLFFVFLFLPTGWRQLFKRFDHIHLEIIPVYLFSKVLKRLWNVFGKAFSLVNRIILIPRLT